MASNAQPSRRSCCQRIGSAAAISLILTACQLGLLAGHAEASLNLVLKDAPDIFSAFIAINYSAGTGQFSADGAALQLVVAKGNSYDITDKDDPDSPGSFELTAAIGSSGVLSGGSLHIAGVVEGLYTSGTLLEGDLTQFGYNGPNKPLEFLFNVTGGDAAPLFGSVGGLLLHSYAVPAVWGSFGTSDAVSDAGSPLGSPIPEPSSLVCWSLLAALGLAGARWRGRNPGVV